MKKTLDDYFEMLWDNGCRDADDLTEENLVDLNKIYMRTTPTKYISYIEFADVYREIPIMMAEWAETEDEYVGYQILNKMRECMLAQTKPRIIEQFKDFLKLMELSARQIKRNQELEIASFDQKRI